MGASTWGYHSFLICPGTLQTAQTTLSAKNTTTLFALTLTAKTGLSLLMITQQRPKLPALDLEVVTSTNSLITLKENGGYGFCRVETGDEESRRAKFFLAAWVPESGPNKLLIMVKGNMSVHKASFKEIFRDFNSEFTFSTEGDLDAEAVVGSIVRLEVPTTWDNKLKF